MSELELIMSELELVTDSEVHLGLEDSEGQLLQRTRVVMMKELGSRY